MCKLHAVVTVPATNSNRAGQMWIRKVQTADLKISTISGNGCLCELPSPKTQEMNWWWSLFNSWYADAKCYALISYSVNSSGQGSAFNY